MDNDNDGNVFGTVPKTGVPGSEALELAPAALYAPTEEGTETRTDWTCAMAGAEPSVMDNRRAMACRMSFMPRL